MTSPPKTDYSEVGIHCLNCGQVQLPPNRDTLDNWSCGYCHSGFLSIAMLSNLAPRELIRVLTGSGKKGAGRACPHCHKAMHDITTSFQQKDVHFEVCRKCRIVWFDSGELLRGLRHREPIVESEEETPLAAKPTQARVPRAKAARRTVAEGRFVPGYTYALIALSLCLMPIASHTPELTTLFGFLPEYPFRGYGLTWVVSIFLHEQASALLIGMVCLFLAGGYAEEKLGHEKYFLLYLVAGIAGRVAYLASAGSSGALYIGSASALAGVVSYTTLVFPFRRVLFPTENRWRSPINAVLWGVVVAVCMYGLYVGYNFIAAALHSVAHGNDAPDFVDSHLKEITTWLDTPAFRGMAAGVGIGFLWSLGDSANRLATRPPPPRSAPLRKTRLHM